MAELIDLVDINNKVIGTTDVATAHQQKQLHRVVGILLFDSSGSLYLQNGNKYKKYDLSVGGHVGQGETYEQAAHREMKEELGVDVKLIDVSTFLSSNAKMGHFWRIYQGELPIDWNFLPTEEVASVIKMSTQELSKTLKLSPELFTHGFINVFNEFNRVKKTDK
jgi:isopentenyl-diphosphate delta-isomerase